MNGFSHHTSVYIFNMSEDVWPFISAMSDMSARSAEILENVYLGDLRMFQFADEDTLVLYVTPHTVSDAFLSYYKSLFPQSKLTVLTTGQHSGVISNDISNDASVMNALVEAANSTKKLTMTSYAVTPQLYTLIRALRDK
mgnify:CR=1 FL=1